MIYNHRNFNVVPSPEDSRDFRYKIKNVPIKLETDLREWDSPIEDQGTLGSCVSHALTSCYELLLKQKVPEKFVDLSRLFSYYHTRILEESVNYDVGVIYIRNSLKAAEKYGICKEELWPYDFEKFSQQPPPIAYLDASKRTILSYTGLNSNLDMLESLSQNKPVIIGMKLYDNFMNITNKNPVVQLPGEFDFVIGGHSVAVVGYSLAKKQYIIKNSFGKDWGDNGYAWLPFEYFEKYVFEKWVFDISEENNTKLI